MKKLKFLVMLLLAVALGCNFTACVGDDDSTTTEQPDGDGDNNSNLNSSEEKLIGKWLMSHSKGYEIYEGQKEEWDESVSAYGYYVTFKTDRTAIADYGEDDVETFAWSVKDKILIMHDVSYDENGTYDEKATIVELTKTKLVLESRESEENYEYWERMTYTRAE